MLFIGGVLATVLRGVGVLPHPTDTRHQGLGIEKGAECKCRCYWQGIKTTHAAWENPKLSTTGPTAATSPLVTVAVVRPLTKTKKPINPMPIAAATAPPMMAPTKEPSSSSSTSLPEASLSARTMTVAVGTEVEGDSDGAEVAGLEVGLDVVGTGVVGAEVDGSIDGTEVLGIEVTGDADGAEVAGLNDGTGVIGAAVVGARLSLHSPPLADIIVM